MKIGGLSKTIVFDTYALINLFEEETGCEKVKEVLKLATKRKIKIYFNEINLGELYYKIWKKKGQEAAMGAFVRTLRFPINLISINRGSILKAAEIKAKNKVSYADAFCIQTAIEYNCPILTGDPEFAKIKGIKIIKLGG